MTTVIKDGRGTGEAAAVDTKGRVSVVGVTQNGLVSAAQTGEAYIVSSGRVTLTSGNESGILYLESLETSPLVIDRIEVQLGQSDGTGDVIRTDHIVGLSGTLISNAVAATSVNLNATSSNTLDSNAYRGAEGDTISGLVSNDAIYQAGTIITQESGLIVPKGAALGLSITPPAGNTSMNVLINAIVHLLEAE